MPVKDLCKVLHRWNDQLIASNDAFPIKSQGIPAKADVYKQRKFLNRYLAEKGHDPVYISDSTHPILNPFLASDWVKKWQDVLFRTNSDQQRININVAIDITSLGFIAKTCNTVNQRSIVELLYAIRRKNLEKNHLYLVQGNAAHNREQSAFNLAKKVRVKI